MPCNIPVSIVGLGPLYNHVMTVVMSETANQKCPRNVRLLISLHLAIISDIPEYVGDRYIYIPMLKTQEMLLAHVCIVQS